ncbi:hypothetical protein FRC16_008507 [Serendipita sp. 398]|nr:hypothetical protein FRC16_008507 [Serendipita sp. 398]
MAFPPMMLNSTLPGVVLPLSRPASSPSSTSPYSQPQTEASGYLNTLSMSDARLSDNVFSSAYYSHSPPSLVPHSRHSSNASATSYSLASTGGLSPADSPPSASSATAPGPPSSFKQSASFGHPQRTTIRRARTGTSPYPREPHIHSNSDVYSSSSEAEELQMYTQPYHHQHNPPHAHPLADPYGSLYIHPSVGNIDPMQSIQQQPHQQHHQMHHQVANPNTIMPSQAQYGRAGPDQNLEQLASNVRSATTTSASDRAKQIFVHAWLNANYTPYADGNVPRQGLYSSYRRVCDQYGIPHMNTATLGKAIRLCFPAIKTRRLGVRGNSKYHYCGIRPSNTTEAEWLQDYIRKTNNVGNNGGGEAGVTRANSQSSRGSGHGGGDSDEDDEADSPDGGQSETPSKRNSLNLDSLKQSGTPIVIDDKTPTTSSVLAAAQNLAPTSMASSSGLQTASVRRRSAQPEPVFSGAPAQGPAGNVATQYSPSQQAATQAGGSYSIRQLPTFPKIEEALGNAGASPQGVAAREVWRWFEDHLDALLESTRALRFDQFEMHLRSFWSNLSGDHREVVHAPAVAGLMAKADALLYDEILETLRSRILAPIPTHALATLRGLADQMEKILLVALANYGSTFVEPKVELGARFGHLVLRFLDIYQVTQALATVLQNPKQMADMRRAWHEIDFESVRNQSALVCNCRHEDLIQLLEHDFVTLLDGLQRSSEPVRDVMIWADDCCERLMGTSRPEDRTTLSSRSVLIRWGYVTSQIMRDLQQFFTLSPNMGAGADYATATGMGAAGLMDHAASSSMMAALNESPYVQSDNSFPSSSLDAGSSSYGAGSTFGSLDTMNFIDQAHASGLSGGDPLLGAGVGVGDMTFGDGGFDVSSFAQEFVMSATPGAAEGDSTSGSKQESPAAV